MILRCFFVYFNLTEIPVALISFSLSTSANAHNFDLISNNAVIF